MAHGQLNISFSHPRTTYMLTVFLLVYIDFFNFDVFFCLFLKRQRFFFCRRHLCHCQRCTIEHRLIWRMANWTSVSAIQNQKNVSEFVLPLLFVSSIVPLCTFSIWHQIILPTDHKVHWIDRHRFCAGVFQMGFGNQMLLFYWIFVILVFNLIFWCVKMFDLDFLRVPNFPFCLGSITYRQHYFGISLPEHLFSSIYVWILPKCFLFFEINQFLTKFSVNNLASFTQLYLLSSLTINPYRSEEPLTTTRNQQTNTQTPRSIAVTHWTKQTKDLVRSSIAAKSSATTLATRKIIKQKTLLRWRPPDLYFSFTLPCPHTPCFPELPM